MPISITCSNCEKALKVPDELAGKKVRCPACKTVIAVPADEETAIEEDAPSPRKSAVKKGSPPPLPKRRAPEDEEDEPLEDESEREDEDDDRPRRRKRRRDADDEDDDDRSIRRKRKKPHRGGTVLTMGILSILFSCIPIAGWILGGVALRMANADLPQMARRKMDPDGEGMTKAGKICGIIGIVFACLALIFNIATFLSGHRLF